MGVGFIGAGNYASSMLMPHLAKNEHVSLRHVATATSLSGVNAQRRFGFERASTDADAVLDDPRVDVVFVLTRHHSHADLVCRALQRGKSVFVEKPLALSFEQLAEVLDVVSATGNDRLMVGFNRRFAPLLTDLKLRFGPSPSASVLRYGVNAGTLSRGSWYTNEELEGSRFVGEGGHFIDTLAWWVDGAPTEVYAMCGGTGSDLQVTVRFDEGSTAGIVYSTLGNSRYPKEILEISTDGRSARLDNFKSASMWAGVRRRTRRSPVVDKGQRVQLDRFVDAVRYDRPMPIPLVVARGDDEGDSRRRAQPRDWDTRTAVTSAGLAWYWRRATKMSPAELVWRGRDQAVRLAWRSRQVRPGERATCATAAPGPLAARTFPTVLPTATALTVPERAERALVDAADSLLRGHWELLGTRRHDVLDPDWFVDPVTGRSAPQAQYAFRVRYKSEAETGNVKQLWELSRHHHVTVLAAAWYRHPRRPLRPARRPSPALVVGAEPVPVRRALDERHRGRDPFDLVDVGPAPARRLARRA